MSQGCRPRREMRDRELGGKTDEKKGVKKGKKADARRREQRKLRD